MAQINTPDDRGRLLSAISPGRYAQNVTPNDNADNCPEEATLLIGGGGTLRIIPVGQEAPVDLVVTDGAQIPIVTRRVMASGTTATNIVAVY
jgi:hypothetical protein